MTSGCFQTLSRVSVSRARLHLSLLRPRGKLLICSMFRFFQAISINIPRIGFAIARRLGLDGASVVISSRKEENVKSATSDLVKQGIDAIGTVCHVSKEEDRQKLIQLVSGFIFF